MLFIYAFGEHDTSEMFKPNIKKMKAAFYEARRSVKKIITTEVSNENVSDKDEGNIFDILTNMYFIFY